MDRKKTIKEIQRYIGYLGLKFCSLVARLLPFRVVFSIAILLGKIGYRMAGKARDIALDSLRLAFGNDKSDEEIRCIARDCFINLVKGGLEIMFLLDRPRLLRRRVSFEGLENLTRALAEKNGVILVSAHFGNFPLMLSKISLEGYPVSAIMRAMRDTRAEGLFVRKRLQVGIHTVYAQPRRECVETSLKVLRNNELLFIPLDQNFGSGGVFVDFFGRKAATATGPVILALRTKAAIVPCFIMRQAGDYHKIIFEPAMKLEEGANADETVLLNVQKITSIIESYIRKYPAEWGWIHRRWKSQPGS